jgi:AraC-like DNA-binding protein
MKNLRLTVVIAVIFTVLGVVLPRDANSSSDAEDFGGPLTYKERMSISAYKECWKIIKENFPRLTSRRRIEMVCGLSYARINRLFENYVNESPLQYVEQLKADQTAELLRQRNESGRGKQTSSPSDACVACR